MATKNIIPRADNEGQIGTTLKKWLKGCFYNLHVGGQLTDGANITSVGALKTHIDSPHAPSDAQANADITKAEIEAKLTGVISSHSHAGGGGAWSVHTSFDYSNVSQVEFINLPDGKYFLDITRGIFSTSVGSGFIVLYQDYTLGDYSPAFYMSTYTFTYNNGLQYRHDAINSSSGLNTEGYDTSPCMQQLQFEVSSTYCPPIKAYGMGRARLSNRLTVSSSYIVNYGGNKIKGIKLVPSDGGTFSIKGTLYKIES